MEINWFTVIAQLINFLILVWLMKKYLYKPIMGAIEERENKIAAELTDAKNKVNEAKKQQEEFQNKNEDFNKHQKTMMDQATADVAAEREKLMELAKKEAIALKQQLTDSADQLQQNLQQEQSKKMEQQVIAITQKALSELAATNLEQQSVQVFIGKLKTITEQDKKQFINAFRTNSAPLVIKSASALTEQERNSIKVAIAAIIGNNGKYEFKTDPKMMSGVELTTNGYRLSWSFSAYINSLQKSISSPLNKSQLADKNA